MVSAYTLAKFFHVFFAIVWIGGGIALSVLAELTRRERRPGAMAAFARQTGWLSTRLFIPSSLIVFLLGFYLVADADWGYPLWVVWGIAGYGASFLLGVIVLGPQSSRLAKLIEAEGQDSPAALSKINFLLNASRVDLLILASVVFAMVTKVGQ